MMEPLMPTIRVCMWIITIVIIIIDLLCIKYRGLAKAYLYLHILKIFVVRLLPNPEAHPIEHPFNLGYIMISQIYCFYCDQPIMLII